MPMKYQEQLMEMYSSIYEKLQKVLNENGPKEFALEFAKLDKKAEKQYKGLCSLWNVGLFVSLGFDVDLMRVVSYHTLRAVEAWCIDSEESVIGKIRKDLYRSPNQKYCFKIIGHDEFLRLQKEEKNSWSSEKILDWLCNKCNRSKELYDYTQMISRVPQYITSQIQMGMYADAQEVINTVAPLALMEPNGKKVNPFVETDSMKQFEGFHLFPIYLDVMQGILDVVWHKKENVSVEVVLDRAYELEFRLNYLKKNEPGLALNPELFIYISVLCERENIDLIKYLSIYKFRASEIDYFMDIIIENRLEIPQMDLSDFYSRPELIDISQNL